ncbi:MAG: TIR domain-containing protein [Halioglobus sp.]
MRYRAFISHSHSDAKFAAWLQRAIETWRVPSRLRDQLGYSRIKPVFRDRTDLRAASSLGESLEEALKNSSALIIVCSNDAADSDWVGKEVERYRQFNPDAPILPIIASGEPPHCFPEQLLIDNDGNALEPLAADARKGFDGKRDALLKTIAGIIDVDFDALKQRDFRRRQQRLGAVAAIATSIAAVTLYLALVAMEARDDANRRREQADDLIAFMLGDLRDKLEPIGKLDVLDAVGEKALGYFSELGGGDITPEVTLKHAMAIRQIGEVQMAQGNLQDAFASFEKSLAILTKMRVDSPGTDRVSYEIAQSEFWLGYVHYERLEIDSARQRFRNYLVEARNLVAQNPDSLEYLVELQSSNVNLGALELEASNYVEAENYLLAALEVFESYEDKLDTIQRLDERYQLHSWLGEIARKSGNLKRAKDQYAKEFTTLQSLVAQSDDKGFREMLSNSARRLAPLEMWIGSLTTAMEYAELATKLSEELIEHDTENYYWLNSHSNASVVHSQLLAASGEHKEALSAAVSAYEASLKLQTMEPGRLDTLLSMGDAATRLASALMADDQPSSADKIVSTALADLNGRNGNEDSSIVEAAYAELQLIQGDLLLREGNPALANQAWKTSLEMATFNAEIDPGVSKLLLLHALHTRLQQRDEANAAWESLGAMGITERRRTSLASVYINPPEQSL